MDFRRCHANENPYDIPLELKEKIAKKILDLPFNHYPEMNSEKMEECFGNYLEIPSENILLGNGSDEILSMFINSMKLSDKLGLFTKDFSMFTFYGEIKGVEISYLDGKIGEITVDEIIDFIQEEEIKLFLFSNPNNPTGSFYSREEIRKILESVPETMIVVDEAYGEFFEDSMLEYYDHYDNLMITKTLSKAVGLPSVRIGCCVGNLENIDRLRSQKVPYNISSFNELVSSTILTEDYFPVIKKHIETIVKNKNSLYKSLKEIKGDFKVYPSAANFIYLEAKDSSELFKKIQKEGILTRLFPEWDGLRISITTEEEIEKILNTIRSFYENS